MKKTETPELAPPPPKVTRTGALRSLLLGGILPVLAFTLVEEYYGTLWGLVAGMTLGVGEILGEWHTKRKVDTITWIGNALLIGMGLISLFSGEGIWFKLQPAIIECVMAIILIGSVIVGKPLLVMMGKKQGMFAQMPASLESAMIRNFNGLTFRIGIFFLLHAAIATWAALFWSTHAWALLKGIGFTGTLILYMILEVVIMRTRIKKPPQ